MRTNPPPLFNHGEGIYFEGIEPMSQTNDAARVRELLFQYLIELQGETPVLSRYTDTMPRPDGLGGQAERERDQAMRRNLMHPDNLTELKMCVDCLEQFRDWRGVWEDVRGALLTGNQPGLAAELKERRERRTADLERMLAAARDLAPMMPTDADTLRKIANADTPGQSAVWDIEKEMQAAISGKTKPTGERAAEPPKVRALDFRKWETAADNFNTGVQGDVAFIENALAEKIVAAFSDFNDRLIQAGGKPFLKAAATPTHAPQNARAELVRLNDQVGLIPPAKIAAMSFREIVAPFEKCISSIINQVLAKLGEVHGEVRDIHGEVRDIQADTTVTALNTATTNNGVAWLVADRQSKIKGNKERGKTNQATGNTEESERAARDMQIALNRVHDRMKHGAKNVIGECRKVCKEFVSLTTKKNALGKCEAYAPLTGANDKPIKPETLAKNYRARFGTKKAKKAKAARTAKPKRRTK